MSSFEDVKFLKFCRRAAEQREERPGKPSAWRAGVTSPGPESTARPGPAARAAAARNYLGPDVFYSQNLVTTITFK